MRRTPTGSKMLQGKWPLSVLLTHSAAIGAVAAALHNGFVAAASAAVVMSLLPMPHCYHPLAVSPRTVLLSLNLAMLPILYEGCGYGVLTVRGGLTRCSARVSRMGDVHA